MASEGLGDASEGTTQPAPDSYMCTNVRSLVVVGPRKNH
jgi:hypothetical protein